MMLKLLAPGQLVQRLRNGFDTHPRSWRAVFLVVLALIVMGMSVKYAAKVVKPGDDGRQTRSAFLRWRSMIHDLFAGENIYIGKNEYPNPPIMAVILRPFAELPPLTGALAWFYAKVVMATLAVLWVFRLVELRPRTDALHESPGMPDSAKVLAIFLALPPLLGDLSHNNVNIFIMFLVAMCLEAYRRGWDRASGLVLALSIACKVTPLLFVAYFVWKRASRVIVGCGIGLLLWLFLVPGLAYGWNRNVELLDSWYALMVRPALVENRITSEHPNQSIPGIVFRLFTHSPSFIEYDKTPEGDIPRAADYHNVLTLEPQIARWIVKGCIAMFALLIMVLCRTPRDVRHGLRFTAECSLIVLGMLLFSERTWKHHAVTLIVPFTAICAALFQSETGSRARTILSGILVLALGLMLITGSLSDHAADLAMVYGTYTVIFLLLTLGSCIILIGYLGRRTEHDLNPRTPITPE